MENDYDVFGNRIHNDFMRCIKIYKEEVLLKKKILVIVWWVNDQVGYCV